MPACKYVSTRGGIDPVDFKDAVMMGLADDGGLIIPEEIPNISEKLNSWAGLEYTDLAYEIMSLFIGDSIPEDSLRTIIKKSYATFDSEEVTPIAAAGGMFIGELFHGPTLAFKDVALQFLGNVFEYILEERKQPLNIIGATSGDTGSAAIYGVRGKKNINIFIMHPHGKVSPVQERQMTSVLDENVHNIAIKGSFDDGQHILKELFNDLAFKKQYHLGAVNSVNWCRVLAQVVYYFYCTFRIQDICGLKDVRVSVPTGNFGDIFAGWIAKQMGAPIAKLILATNENDILSRFFNTGNYERSSVNQTLSPSMDIQVASNFERYLYFRVGKNGAKVKELMETFAKTGKITVAGSDSDFAAGAGDTEATLATIRKYHEAHEYLLDPHTAVGVNVAETLTTECLPTLCLATAHPAKFGDAVKEAIGENIAHHKRIDGLMELPTRCVVLPAQKKDIEKHIKTTLG